MGYRRLSTIQSALFQGRFRVAIHLHRADYAIYHDIAHWAHSRWRHDPDAFACEVAPNRLMMRDADGLVEFLERFGEWVYFVGHATGNDRDGRVAIAA